MCVFSVFFLINSYLIMRCIMDVIWVFSFFFLINNEKKRNKDITMYLKRNTVHKAYSNGLIVDYWHWRETAWSDEISLQLLSMHCFIPREKAVNKQWHYYFSSIQKVNHLLHKRICTDCEQLITSSSFVAFIVSTGGWRAPAYGTIQS